MPSDIAHLNDAGQPVLITSEFIKDEVAYSRETLLLWSEEDRNALGVYAVAEPTVPDGKVVASQELGAVDGKPAWVAVLADPPRRTIPKSVVQERVNDIGKLDDVLAVLQSAGHAIYYARWFAPDWPEVYADDAGLLQILGVVGCTPEQIATITAPA